MRCVPIDRDGTEVGVLVGLTDRGGIEGYSEVSFALYTTRVVLTASEGILFCLADVIRDLEPGTMPACLSMKV